MSGRIYERVLLDFACNQITCRRCSNVVCSVCMDKACFWWSSLYVITCVVFTRTRTSSGVGIIMVADVSGNYFGDAGATALCPLLEHQPNLKNLDLSGKCIVWLRYVHILVVMCGMGTFISMHMCAFHRVYTFCGVMSCLHMNEMSF